jgi:surfactin synthase thioesterase subunit
VHKHIYIFSGLGADEKAFQKLDLEAYRVTHIRWIKPRANEPIENYAGRLLEQVITPSPVLMGLSFGGIMAIEVSKHISTEKIILLSSVKTKKEIPLSYRILGRMGFRKFVPVQSLRHPNFITNYLFGARTSEDKELLKPMLENMNIDLLKWAMDKVAFWKNGFVPENITHIHGTADKILPYGNVKCDYTIVDGGHMMVLNHAQKVNEILREII